MFGLFKKKANTNDIRPDSQWRVAQGEHEGSPVLVRINASLESLAGNGELPLKIGFAIPFNHPNAGGMPDPEENRQLESIEDRIFEVLLSKGAVKFALVLTMGAFKEFVFYSVSTLDIKAAHEQLMGEIASHELQCYACIEEGWETYREWTDC